MSYNRSMDLIQNILKKSIAKVEAAQLDINPPEKQLHPVKGKKALGKEKNQRREN